MNKNYQTALLNIGRAALVAICVSGHRLVSRKAASQAECEIQCTAAARRHWIN